MIWGRRCPIHGERAKPLVGRRRLLILIVVCCVCVCGCVLICVGGCLTTIPGFKHQLMFPDVTV
jgi:hypothetical protein